MTRFKTFSDVRVLTERYYLHSVVCGGAKHGGRPPPAPRHGSPVSLNDIWIDGAAARAKSQRFRSRSPPGSRLGPGASGGDLSSFERTPPRQLWPPTHPHPHRSADTDRGSDTGLIMIAQLINMAAYCLSRKLKSYLLTIFKLA